MSRVCVSGSGSWAGWSQSLPPDMNLASCAIPRRRQAPRRHPAIEYVEYNRALSRSDSATSMFSMVQKVSEAGAQN